MRGRILAAGFVAWTMAAIILTPPSAEGRTPDRPAHLGPIHEDQEFVPGELVVRFKPGLRATARGSVLAAEDALLKQELLLPGVTLVRLSAGESVTAAAAAFERHAEVLYAEPNYLHRIAAIPDDPRFGELWGLHQPSDADIDAPGAWDVTTGSSEVVVAVVDSGVAYQHPDLAPNMWQNDPPGGGDQDGNGKIDDTHGWDFIQNDNTPFDFNGHGTHVAGTIGAQGNNALGITGVNWDVSIMALRAGDANGSLPEAAIVDAFGYACAEGADIVNGSFGASVMSLAIRDAVLACPNVLFVFAAGNEAKDLDGTGSANDSFPCELHLAPTSATNVLCVAGTAQNDTLASFSNHGSTAVHLAAPGVDILSSWPAYTTIWFENFDYASDGEFDAAWGDRTFTPGDALWGRTTALKTSGTHSLTDSPAGPYANNTDSTIRRMAPFSLAVEAGCRALYDLRLDSELGFDGLLLMTGTLTTTTTVAGSVSGSSGGAFIPFSTNLSMMDGQPIVYLRLRFYSDSSITGDGAYVDDLSVSCLNHGGEDYNAISGTSMATPHVAGVAALLLAQDPARTVAQLKTALTSSVDVLPSLDDKAITEGRLNACKALGRMAEQCDGGADTDPPETTITDGPTGFTNDSTPTYSFSSDEPGSTFACRFDSDGFAACTSPHTPAAPLADGPHTFEVQATDSGSNVDPTPDSRSFTVDTVLPTDPVLDSPSHDVGVLSDDPTVEITWTGASDATAGVDGFSYSWDTSPATVPDMTKDAEEDAAGATSPTLTDGSNHWFHLRTLDNAGNWTSTVHLGPFVIDSVAPNTTITGGPSGPTNDASPTFTFSSNEGNSTFECRVDAEPFGACSGPGNSHTTGVLSDGAHTFEVRATDAAGHTDATPASRSFTVDTDQPQTSITGGPSGPTFDRTPRFKFKSDEPGSSFQCKLDRKAWRGCTSPKQYGSLGFGKHTFRVRATDPAGNTDATPAKRTFTIKRRP